MKDELIKHTKDFLKKSSIVLLTCMFLFFSMLPVHAEAVPTPPTAPTAPSAPTAPQQPSPPPSPSTTTSPQPTPATDPTNTSSTPTDTQSATVTPTPTAAISTTSLTGSQPGSTSSTTGNATAGSSSTTTGNSNLATSPTSSSGPFPVTNAANGADSTNTVSTDITKTTSAIQTNTGISAQTLTQNSTTGRNNASENVGDTSTTTGDANVSGTIVTAQNTNVDGVAVAEFNVNDNHTGDIILDFGANCISGCSSTVPGEVVKNIDNGEGSTNTATASGTTNTTTFQNNDATAGNNLVLSANSGDNLSNKNTGGATSLQTGNANVSGNSLTFLNNNISGNVVYGIVNIYGDLEGDIILPQSVLDTFNPCPNGCNTNGSTLTNAGNGTSSTNTATANQTNTNFLSQNNDAVIDNNLQLASSTGGNQATRNTGGTTTVTTGQASADSHVLNIANSNISGGNFWLVLINKAGQWIGQLLGAPSGSNVASNGLTLTTDANGNVVATNNGNGAESTNTASSTTTTNNTTTQNNTAHVGNTLTLAANTGNNTANDNTGGNVNVQTGDAKILANIVNFVNNNIIGNGKLFVTVVNVFGKWVGDFVTPGQQKQTHTTTQNSTSQNNTATTTGSNTSQKQQTVPTSIPNLNVNANINPNTPNQIITQEAGAPSHAVLGTISTVFQNGEKTTVAAIHTTLPLRNALRINLAWVLLFIPPFTIALLLRKNWRKKSTL